MLFRSNVGVEFGLEGVVLEEISKLPSEEVLGEVLGWKEHVVGLRITGRGLE